MSDIVLSVENLWKQYRLGVVGASSLREDVGRLMAKLRGKEDPTLKIGETNDRENIKGQYIWALQDINFEIKRGEVVGIIGKNGAGKSTLLKILSKVTTPTKGTVRAKGRIASLLEVGTGFHPELTGRENIFLNGAILGMTKNDIHKKFDEIVEFSGIGKYIDTPVKRYSSGMYVRLAFAVAAHLEPEILIVDEVLAVGDVEFQKKCLGKMKDVSGEGRTVLFVSHNMAALQNLCSKSFLLKSGKMILPLSDTKSVVSFYLRENKNSNSVPIKDISERLGEGKVRIIEFRVTDEQDNDLETIISGQEVFFKIYYKTFLQIELPNLIAALSISTTDGFLITVLSSEFTGCAIQTNSQEGYLECKVHKFPLTGGEYMVNLIIRYQNLIQDWIQEARCIRVEDGDFFNTGRAIPASHRSSVLLEQIWSLKN